MLCYLAAGVVAHRGGWGMDATVQAVLAASIKHSRHLEISSWTGHDKQLFLNQNQYKKKPKFH
jgi:hypothetical protein